VGLDFVQQELIGSLDHWLAIAVSDRL